MFPAFFVILKLICKVWIGLLSTKQKVEGHELRFRQEKIS